MKNSTDPWAHWSILAPPETNPESNRVSLIGPPQWRRAHNRGTVENLRNKEKDGVPGLASVEFGYNLNDPVFWEAPSKEELRVKVPPSGLDNSGPRFHFLEHDKVTTYAECCLGSTLFLKLFKSRLLCCFCDPPDMSGRFSFCWYLEPQFLVVCGFREQFFSKQSSQYRRNWLWCCMDGTCPWVGYLFLLGLYLSLCLLLVQSTEIFNFIASSALLSFIWFLHHIYSLSSLSLISKGISSPFEKLVSHLHCTFSSTWPLPVFIFCH